MEENTQIINSTVPANDMVTEDSKKKKKTNDIIAG